MNYLLPKIKPNAMLNYVHDFLKKKTVVVAAVSFLAANAQAQKKPLDHSVYDEWQSIGYSLLSNDGSWAAYQIKTQESDNTLAVFGIPSKQVQQFHRGDQVKFTSDSKFAIFNIKPFYRDIKAVKIKKKKEHELAKDSIGILNLETQKVEKLPNLKSFKVPEKGWCYKYDTRKGKKQ